MVVHVIGGVRKNAVCCKELGFTYRVSKAPVPKCPLPEIISRIIKSPLSSISGSYYNVPKAIFYLLKGTVDLQDPWI